jgi:thioredoxin reductase
MDVIVVGGGNAAFETAAQLLAYCKSVTLLNRSDVFRADEITVEKLSQNPKLRLVKNVEMLEVLGEKFVSGMKIKHLNTGEEETINAMGVFVEIGQSANSEFMTDFVDTDKTGKIIIDPWTQTTTRTGVWAAGDITNIKYHQNNIAAGDGVKALEDIYQWLQKN